MSILHLIEFAVLLIASAISPLDSNKVAELADKLSADWEYSSSAVDS